MQQRSQSGCKLCFIIVTSRQLDVVNYYGAMSAVPRHRQILNKRQYFSLQEVYRENCCVSLVYLLRSMQLTTLLAAFSQNTIIRGIICYSMSRSGMLHAYGSLIAVRKPMCSKQREHATNISINFIITRNQIEYISSFLID